MRVGPMLGCLWGEYKSLNILFITLLDFKSIDEQGIYTDLLREFANNNHNLYIVSPTEKRNNISTHIIENDNCKILKLKIGNMQKTNVIEKGISTLTIENKMKNGIREYFKDIKFDLVVYSTPPITFYNAIKYVKNRDDAKTYLLLKDIFPQNAVDMELINKKSLLYKFFRNKEKRLYRISDFIGCMSDANKSYVINNNPEVEISKVEINPNSIDIRNIDTSNIDIQLVREKYKIPKNKTIFIYGGNLGKPQGIEFLINCLKSNKDNNEAHFIIVGAGTEYIKLERHVRLEKYSNVQLFSQMYKSEYEELVKASDVGLIFLDSRFTIPNFPSRLLSYMQFSLPVLASTDINTDIKDVLKDGEFGLWNESTDLESFKKNVELLSDANFRSRLGVNAKEYLLENYSSEKSYNIIMNHFKRLGN